jgi:hypothetical protein
MLLTATWYYFLGLSFSINPAIQYLKVVIPAKAGRA